MDQLSAPLLSVPCKVFLFRLSGTTAGRGAIKGEQQVVWTGAQRHNMHAHTHKHKSPEHSGKHTNAWSHTFTHTYMATLGEWTPLSTGQPSPLSYISGESHLTHTASLILSTQHASLMVRLSSSPALKCFSCFSERNYTPPSIPMHEASPPASQADLLSFQKHRVYSFDFPPR